MNIANLQLAGLLGNILTINHIMVQKSALSAEEIDISLHKAEASETEEERSEGPPSSHRDAINFPIRTLQ